MRNYKRDAGEINRLLGMKTLESAAMYLAKNYEIRDPIVAMASPNDLWPIRVAAQLIIALNTVIEMGKIEDID